jgi:hypothetical protein
MSKPSRSARVSILLASAFALAPLAGHAQAWIKPGDETMILRLGGLNSSIDSSVRLDGSRGGTVIDLESKGGLNGDVNTFFLGATWRVAPRHRIDMLYDENSRDATRNTEREYVIDDVVIPAGTPLYAENKVKIGYLAYRYSFMKTPTSEIAAGLGMYGANFKFRFQSGAPTSVNIDESTTLPLPVLALTGDFYLTDRTTLRAGINGLKVKIGDVDGSVLTANVAGEYQLTNNFGLGLAVEYFDLSADVTKSGFHGNAELKSTKAMLYLTGRF